MENKDYKPVTGAKDRAIQDQPCDKPDCVLDAALAKYSAVEPRAGLEERILASLRAEKTQAADRSWWQWGLAAALAAVVVMAVTLAWRPGKHAAPVIVKQMPAGTQDAAKPRIAVVNRKENAASARLHSMAATHQPKAATSYPQLDQFPSRQPLSEQELALARYVNAFPQEATLIARLQEDYEQEIQQKMKEARSETEFFDSNRQER